MAQTLNEDQGYSLIATEHNQSQKRRVYFVKLTDSCLKAIEEHITFKAATQSKPKIKFDGNNEGCLTIPSKPGSASQDVGKKFNFSIAPLNPSGSNQGILECIKHAPQKNSNTLLSFGALESKINIAATDDVYENTRNRMAQVDQERKDVRTKEIKLSGNTKQGKKPRAKVVQPTDHNRLSSIKKKQPPFHTTSSPKTSAVLSSTQRAASPATSTYNHQSQRNSPLNGVGKNFSCRERVLHVLAIRPHKKPELMARLQREAMSQKDRNNLKMVLQQVSSLVDNQYKIHSHLYTEINADTWPFYSENEKFLVKRNIAQYKKSTDTSPQLVSSTSKSPEEKVVSKRPLSHNDFVTNPKKPKLETSSKREEPSSTSTTAITTNRKPGKVISPKSSKERDKSRESKEREKPNAQQAESPPTVASTSDTPEYLVTYKPIKSYEQRCAYKRDFQAEYPEYIELKKSVDSVTTKFIELDRSWRRTEKGSKEYYKIQDEIVAAYNKQQKDEKFHAMKRRCQELHEKLFHIKRLVVEYDNAHVGNT